MQIDFYDFGRIKIGGKIYERDVIIFPDRVFSPWSRKESHYFDTDDLLQIPDLIKDGEFDSRLGVELPSTIIIGTGYDGVMQVAPDVEEFFTEVIIEKTTDAWKTYNELSQNKKVLAFLHLTC